jgi:hypothetical protein
MCLDQRTLGRSSRSMDWCWHWLALLAVNGCCHPHSVWSQYTHSLFLCYRCCCLTSCTSVFLQYAMNLCKNPLLRMRGARVVRSPVTWGSRHIGYRLLMYQWNLRFHFIQTTKDGCADIRRFSKRNTKQKRFSIQAVHYVSMRGYSRRPSFRFRANADDEQALSSTRHRPIWQQATAYK